MKLKIEQTYKMKKWYINWKQRTESTTEADARNKIEYFLK